MMFEVRSAGGSGRGAELPTQRSAAAASTDGRGAVVADPELVARPTRRRFSAEFKLRVLAEADACRAPGEVGELLRREGLYSSHLVTWRRQRKEGALKALSRPRGRKPGDGRDGEIAALTRRAQRAEAELEKARKVIEIQGNVSALLEQMLSAEGASEAGSSGR